MTDIVYNATHATCLPAKVLARDHGAHIVSLVLKKDTDNGALLGKGDFVKTGDFDAYDEADAKTFNGVIEAYENGHYLVEVNGDTDAYLVYQDPIIDGSDLTSVKRNAHYFYNKQGDYVRSYQLKDGDTFWLSPEGFDGTPSVGAKVTVGRKPKIAAGA